MQTPAKNVDKAQSAAVNTVPEEKNRNGAAGLWRRARASSISGTLFALFVPAVILVCSEWVARGSLADTTARDGFFQSLSVRFPSFFMTYLLYLFIYIFFVQLTGRHWAGTLVTGLIGNVPAVVTHYKLTMRGEPFLPWDLSQIEDLLAVSSEITLQVPARIWVVLGILVGMVAMAVFIKPPHAGPERMPVKHRLLWAGCALGLCFALLFGIFLNPAGSKAIGINGDAWMQDRYYRYYGNTTGFLTNLQMLRINVPDDYSADHAEELAQQAAAQAETRQPYYANSYGTVNNMAKEQPDIIFLMAESFWDVTALEGISYSEDVLANLTQLRSEAAWGNVYTPSFGGGTCDVEFEALTGFSVEHLPAGSKPYQQYVTKDMFSLPQFLKSQGYSTTAIHGYGRKFWSRDVAYPRLGIDEFIASEDFVSPVLRRGFISDDAMVTRIIEEYEEKLQDGPVFIHAVTMQNHTTYSRDRYPQDELVRVVGNEAGLEDNVVGQLEDCATGIREMDAALGRLTEYLKTAGRPTLLVFWGDHLNPMSDGYKMFEQTGFIDEGDTASPKLHQTPLLIWSNYSEQEVQLGTISAYNIAPAMMELYGLDMPLYFEYLVQQMQLYTGRSKGVTILPDSTTVYELDEAQQQAFEAHASLQYNYMFDEPVLPDYVPEE